MFPLFYDGQTSTYSLPLTEKLTIKFIYLEPPHYSILRLLENNKSIHQAGIPPKLANEIEEYCAKLNHEVLLEDFTNQLRDWQLTDFFTLLSDSAISKPPIR